MFDSKQIYQNFISYRNSDEWLTLPDEEKAAIEAKVKEAHQNVLNQELQAPIVTPFDQPAPVEYEEVTPWTTAKNVGKSFVRIPHALTSTLATGVGYGADLVGADNVAKNLYDTANQIDQQAQGFAPNTFKPIENLDEIKNAFDSPGNFGELVGKLASNAPEMIGTTAAMALSGAGAAKFGSLFSKSDKLMKALRLLGTGAGSAAASGGGIQRDQYNKTGELPDAIDALPYALGVGALDFLPGTMEQGFAKWLTGEAGQEVLGRSLLGKSWDAFKSIATEGIQEGSQSGIEGSYQFKDQGFLPSLKTGFQDPGVQTQMFVEGATASLLPLGGAVMNRSGNNLPSLPDLPDLKNIKTEAEALEYMSKVAGLTDEQREAYARQIKERFSTPPSPPAAAGEQVEPSFPPEILPTHQELDDRLMSGMATAERNQRGNMRQYLDLVNKLKAENTPESLNQARALEDEFFNRFGKYDPYYVEDEINKTPIVSPPAKPFGANPASPAKNVLPAQETLSPEEKINQAYRAATILEASMNGDQQAASDWNQIPWETQVAAKHILEAEKTGKPVDMKLVAANINDLQNENDALPPAETPAVPEIKNTDARVQFGLGVLKKIAKDPTNVKNQKLLQKFNDLDPAIQARAQELYQELMAGGQNSLGAARSAAENIKAQGYVQTDGLAGLRGKPTKIRTPRGFEVEGEYRIVEADAGRNSFHDGYSVELQDRDTDKSTSREQIEKIRDKVIPADLITDFEGADVGAPIFGINPADGQLETEIGNHRDQGIREGYQTGRYESYKKQLLEKAEALGFNPEEVARMKNPKLIRVRTTELSPEDRMSFANSGNAPRGMAKSAAEVALTDAKYIGPALSSISVTEDGEINTAGNRDFFRQFLGAVASPQELNKLITRDGNALTQEGVNRVRNAIFAAAYENSDLVERLADSADERIKRVLSGMTAAAADTAVTKSEIAKGNLYDLQIADDVARAVDKLAEIRNNGQTVDGYLSQGQFFDDGMTPESRLLLKIAEKAKSARVFSDLITGFNGVVKNMGSPAQGNLFGENVMPSKVSILENLIDLYHPELADKKTAIKQGPAVAEKQARPVNSGWERAKAAVRAATDRVERDWNNEELTEADLPQFSRKRPNNQPGLFDTERQPTLFEWLAARDKAQQPANAKPQQQKTEQTQAPTPSGSPVQKGLFDQNPYAKKLQDAVKTVSGKKEDVAAGEQKAEPVPAGHRVDSVNGIFIVRRLDGSVVKDYMTTNKAQAEAKAQALNEDLAKSDKKAPESGKNEQAKESGDGQGTGKDFLTVEKSQSTLTDNKSLSVDEGKYTVKAVGGGHAIIAPDGSQFSWGTNQDAIERRAEKLNSELAAKTQPVEKKTDQETVKQSKPEPKPIPEQKERKVEELVNEPTFARVLKNIELAKKQGMKPYILVQRKLDGGRYVYEAYSPEGQLLASAPGLSGKGSISDKFFNRKDRYFDVASFFIPLTKDEVFSLDRLRAEAKASDDRIKKPDVAKGEKTKTSTPGKIEDFGEKLGGAKKDKIKSIFQTFSDDDLRKMPLSQIWPKSEIDEIEDVRAAAFATAARAEIPNKPRKSYALTRWVEKIKTVRDLTKRFMEDPDGVMQKMKEKSSSLREFAFKVEILEKLPRESWGRISDVSYYPDAYSYGEDGQKIPRPSVGVRVDGRYYSRHGASLETAVELAKEKLGASEVASLKMQFEVRDSATAKGRYKINKKGDPLYRTLKSFDTVKEAHEFVRNNIQELVAEWEKIKERDNVSESDVRRGENRIRSGEDYRKGRDVTPEMFSDAFGFRGVEFGNWVSQGKNMKERQGMLNVAYDALMDLAGVLKVPPKALSLNGTLGVGFGSRGGGKASAHYEPNNIVINLTKTKGAGTLAHEWFHALDNYFARLRGGEKRVMRFEGQSAYQDQNYITHRPDALFVHKDYGTKVSQAELQARRERFPDRDYYKAENWKPDPDHRAGVRPEVEKSFAKLVSALDDSPMTVRSELIDKGRSSRYWSSTLERAARAFEVFIIDSLNDKGRHNDYLANVTSLEDFARDEGRYPYLLPGESAPVKKAFKELFETVKTKDTEKGVALYSRKGGAAEKFRKDLRELAKNDFYSSKSLVIGETPEILRRLGAQDFKITIHPETVHRAVVGKHNLSIESLEQLPEALGKPIMVFNSKTRKGSLVVLTEIKDKNGKSAMAAVRLAAKESRHVVNSVTSIYGKDNEATFVNWLNDGLGRYINMKKASAWAQSIGLQLPKEERLLQQQPRSSTKIIVDRGEKVKNSSGSNDPSSAEKLALLEKIIADQEGEAIIGTFKEVAPKSIKEGAAVVEAFKALFGKKVIFFDAGDKLNIQFNGVVAPAAMPDTIFVEAKTDKAALRVSGHELLHVLKADSLEAYKDLEETLLALMNEKAFSEYKARLAELGGNLSDSAVTEELIGDFIGDQMSNKDFWGKLARKSPSLFKRVAALIQDLFSRVKGWLAENDYQTSQFFSDIEAAQDAVVKTIAAYGQRKADQTGNQKLNDAVRQAMGKKSELGKVARALAEAKKDRSGTKIVADAIKSSYAGKRATGFKAAEGAGKTFEGPYDGMARFEVDDSKSHWNIPADSMMDDPKNPNQMAVVENLGDIFNHPTLFKNYPALKSLPVKILINPDFAPTGAYYPKSGNIVLAVPDLEVGRKVLLHEIQHSIQEVEGFAKGGDWREFAKSRKDQIAALEEKVGELNKKMKKAVGTPDYERLMSERSTVVDEIIKLEGSSEAGADFAGYEDYRRTAGEIEARDVEDRMDLTAEEREEFEPFSSAEYDPEETIVMFSRIRKESKPVSSNKELKKLDQKWEESGHGDAWQLAKKNSTTLINPRHFSSIFSMATNKIQKILSDLYKDLCSWLKGLKKRLIKQRFSASSRPGTSRGYLESLERRSDNVSWAPFMKQGRSPMERAFVNAQKAALQDPRLKAVYVEIDIKNQKKINDKLGEDGADNLVLAKYAEFLKEQMDAISVDSLYAKVGGDELGAVLLVPAGVGIDEVRAFATMANNTSIKHASGIEGLDKDLENARALEPVDHELSIRKLAANGIDYSDDLARFEKKYWDYLTGRGLGFRIGVEDVFDNEYSVVRKSIENQHKAEKKGEGPNKYELIRMLREKISSVKSSERRRIGPNKKHEPSGKTPIQLEYADPEDSGGRSLQRISDTSGGKPELYDKSGKVKFSLSELERIAANPDQITDDDKPFLQQVKHFVTHGLVHLTSEISEMDPAFKAALARNPEARTPEEIFRALKIETTNDSRKAKDAVLAAHIRADNSKLIDLAIKYTKPGAFRDWLVKNIRRIVAPFHQAQNIQKVMFMIAERIYWNGEKMIAAPGFRTQDESGNYVYTWENSLVDGETAMKAFNQLPQELKDILVERAKKNEQYRQEFVNKWIPRRKVTVGLGAMARLLKQLHAGEERADQNRRTWEKLTAGVGRSLDDLETKLTGAKGQAALKQLRERFDFLRNRFDQDNSGILKTLETVPESERSIGSLMQEYNSVSGNRGHFGYVHHAFEAKLSKNLSPGSGFDASGKFDHPWFEAISDTHRIREGGMGRVGSLMQADIAQRVKEIRADRRNDWMANIEDEYGITPESVMDSEGNIQLPDGYDKKSWVVANFGKFAGQKIYVPTNVFALYKQTLERGTVDPELKEISGILDSANQAIGLINEAMLYHPAKFARDLYSAPFHIAEFIRDWTIKNPEDWADVWSLLGKGMKSALSPSEWQRMNPASFGEYSESLAFQDRKNDSLITKALNAVSGNKQAGSVLASLLKQINLAGAADLPIKRIMKVVGEGLADKRGLKGQDRERFVYKVMNQYAFDTGDLPGFFSFIRGGRPDSTSKVAGAVSRATIPFMGYATRLARQLLVTPFTHGVLGMGERTDAKYRFAEISRPLVWMAGAMLIRAGAFGNPPEEEEAAGGLKNKRNLDYAARTATRVLVGREDDKDGGEYYMAAKGYGHLSFADSVLGAIRGKQSWGDVVQELGNLHPAAKTILSTLGMEDPYSKNIPFSAKAGRMAAMLLLPQSTRLGNDVERLLRLAFKEGALPDQERDNFFTAFISQLGIPVTEAKYRNGKIVTTKPWIEAVKAAGFNIRYIPYEIVEGEVNKEIPSLKRLAEKIKKIQAEGPKPWAGKKTSDGKPMNETQWLISKGLLGKGRTLVEAREAMEKELRERSSGLSQTVKALRRVGYKMDDVVDSGEDYAKQALSAVKKISQPKSEDVFKRLLKN